MATTAGERSVGATAKRGAAGAAMCRAKAGAASRSMLKNCMMFIDRRGRRRRGETARGSNLGMELDLDICWTFRRALQRFTPLVVAIFLLSASLRTVMRLQQQEPRRQKNVRMIYV